MHRTKNDILISGVLVIVFLWFVWEARDWPFRTRFFPLAIGFPVLVLAFVQLGLSIRQALRRQPSQKAPGSQAEAEEAAIDGGARDEALLRQRTLGIAAWAVAFALGLWIFGFKVGGLLMSLCFLRFQAHESWRMSIAYALAVYLFFFAGLELGLAVPLPPGLLADSLGLDSFDSYLMNPILNLMARWW